MNQPKYLMLVWTFAGLLAAAAQARYDIDHGPKWLAPTGEYVTPHIPWLKPNSQGTLKVLFLTHRGAMREAIELSQRFDLQASVFAMDLADEFFLENESYYFPLHPTADEMEADALEKLNVKYDVIAAGNIKWSALPMAARYRIFKQISEGTALVCMREKPDDYLKRATTTKSAAELSMLFPFKGLPAFQRYASLRELLQSTIEVSSFGKGKIYALKGYKAGQLQLLTPAATGNPLNVKRVEYDYYLAYIGRLLLCAGGKKPALTIKGPSFIERDGLDPRPCEFIIASQKSFEASLKTVLRNKDNEIIREQQSHLVLQPGENKIAFDPGAIPAGGYFADIWVSKDGRGIDFGSAYMEVRSSTTIASIDFQKAWRKEDAPCGLVSIANPDGDWNQAWMTVSRKDNFGRLTGKIRIELDGTKESTVQIPFKLPPSAPLSIIQHLEVELGKGAAVIDKQKNVYSISNLPPKDDYRYIFWARPFEGYLSYPIFELAAQAGFDTHYGDQPGAFTEAAFLANLWHRPYCSDSTKMFDNVKFDAANHLRIPCPNDPKMLKSVAAELLKTVEKEKAFSTMEYSMGDELYFADYAQKEVCFCPHCQAGFRQTLAVEYSSLEEVNRKYQSNYTSFDQIAPVTLQQARQEPRLAPLWVDYRRFMETTWANLFHFVRQVITAEIPGAKTGYEASDHYINSFCADYYKMMRSMQINNPYNSDFMVYAIADFSDPQTLLGLGWDGGYHGGRSPEYQKYIVWRNLFRGARSQAIFLIGPGTFGESVMAPDFSFYDYFKPGIKEVNELQQGIGKLLMSSKRENDGIAILYSASSVHASTLAQDFPSMQKVLDNWIPLLTDVGCQFQIIACQQLADGILQKENFKTLILPYAQALSPQEISRIKDFVKNGGAVLADLRPGVRDQHGRPYDTSPLDEVFGVKQNTSSPCPKKGTLAIESDEADNPIKDALNDASLKLTDGRAMAKSDETPLVINHHYGKGRAVLLNLSLADYILAVHSLESGSSASMNANSPKYRRLIARQMADLGWKPKITIDPVIKGLQTYRFANGSHEYLGLLQDLPENTMNYASGKARPLDRTAIKIKLQKPRHVYDMRLKQYLGYVDRLAITIEPAQAQLFSFLPDRKREIKLKLPPQVRQGQPLEYQADWPLHAAESQQCVFHAALLSPAGDKPRYYEANLLFKNGRLKGVIPLALNEKTGKWQLIVNDIASGMVAAEYFQICEAK
ncbi:MAG: beta-galactosidase trimerization domain-containing protein [Verrucomicrobiae bacterium]|nr:beta-galactosidase trimerization domain-containing protein [Verrucomicrobiae bacterium]